MPYNIDLDSILEEVIAILRAHGFMDKAAWLDERRSDLRSAPDTERAEVLRSIHAVIPGMGGLVDIPLSDHVARARLGVLADRLYELTR